MAEETNLPDELQKQIINGTSSQFTVSKFSSGKQMRSYHDIVKEAWEQSGLQPFQMPLQGLVQEPFRQAAKAAGRWDLIGNPSGQIGGTLKERRSAKQILMDMVEEARETIADLQQKI